MKKINGLCGIPDSIMDEVVKDLRGREEGYTQVLSKTNGFDWRARLIAGEWFVELA